MHGLERRTGGVVGADHAIENIVSDTMHDEFLQRIPAGFVSAGTHAALNIRRNAQVFADDLRVLVIVSGADRVREVGPCHRRARKRPVLDKTQLLGAFGQVLPVFHRRRRQDNLQARFNPDVIEAACFFVAQILERRQARIGDDAALAVHCLPRAVSRFERPVLRLCRVDVLAVNRRHMIVLERILQPHFPVAFDLVDVAVSKLHLLEPVITEKGRQRPERLHQRLRSRIESHKDEAGPKFSA